MEIANFDLGLDIFDSDTESEHMQVVTACKRDLLEYIKSKRNKSTTKKGEYEYGKFSQWLREQGELRSTYDLEAARLDSFLGHYLLQCKRKDGTEYKPDTLTSIHR